MKMTRAVVPSLFTVLNMFCGFLSIISAVHNDLRMAAWLIILGAIFDSLDGIMARLTKSSSAFGVEFDSLSDVVTFGAAPSLLMYLVYLDTLGAVGVLLSSLPLIFGSIRLARFNVQLVGFDKDYFKGLPIPAQALTLCTFILTYSDQTGHLVGWPSDILAPMVIILATLMLSNIKYDTLPKFSKRGLREHRPRIIFFIAATILIVFTKGTAFFAVLVAFVASGLIRWLLKTMRGSNRPLENGEDPEVSRIDF